MLGHASAVPPYIVAPLPRCAILLERHTHKNGGSTMRSILNQNDMRDGWAFWGYGLHQHPLIIKRLIDVLLGPRNSTRRCSDWSQRAPLRLFAEHHYSRHSLEAILSHFGPYSPLQHAAFRCSCRVVLATRLREPLSFYLSFYRWTVNWRQQRNASAFGKTMLEWAPRNLQSSMLLNPLDTTWAEYVGVHSKEGEWRRKVYSQFDEPGDLPGGATSMPPGAGARRRGELRRVMQAFDLIGLVERFDESLLLLADLTGMQRLLYERLSPESTNAHYRQPSVDEVCPDRAACLQRIRQIAPMDFAIHADAAVAFDEKVRAQGPTFGARLEAYRLALRRYQARRSRVRNLGLDVDEHRNVRVMERMASA